MSRDKPLCPGMSQDKITKGVNSNMTAYKESDQIGYSGLLEITFLEKTKKQEKDVLKQEKDVLEQEKDILKQERKF